jgi:hypothetical protein
VDLPEPGTDEPFAVIRHLPVQRNAVKVMAYRVVTWAELRRLIREGYFPTLDDAARACHATRFASAVDPALNVQKQFDQM